VYSDLYFTYLEINPLGKPAVDLLSAGTLGSLFMLLYDVICCGVPRLLQ